VHLSELASKVGPSDSGLEVAWLGLYSSRFALALVWVSVLLLPCLAVAMLGLKGADYDGGLLWKAIEQDWKSLSLWVLLPTTLAGVFGALSCLASNKLASLAAMASADKDTTFAAIPLSETTEALSAPKSESDGLGSE
jgi:hypothetical protein